jgi:broad specificity phosphatase PhoE
MPTLYLVRHGQASFGADDYDQLSALGARQCLALGEWFATRGHRFQGVLRGTLKRHEQSLAAFAEGHAAPLPDALAWPGLNEYDSLALIRTVHAGELPKPDTPEVYRAHFRLLREALARWMAGDTRPEGMPSWAEFQAGVADALAHVQRTHDGDVLLVSSGGPIATAVAHAMRAPAESVIELNLRLRNSAVCALNFSRSRLTLDTFNHVPHLEHADRAGWVTYT